jgi:hypothetical protein
VSDLEDELRAALRRMDPPEGFAERVLARTAVARRSRGRSVIVRLAWAATLIVVLGTGGHLYQKRQERIRGERAKQEVVLALRLVARELDHAMQKVQERNSVR